MHNMNIDSLDALLEKLNSGDAAAAEQVFIAYEPYLRKVVRRLLPAELRAKFDSIDVVQSVYGDVLAAFRDGGMRFTTVAQLRAFLIKATRNRFIDRVRQHRTAARLEQPLVETESDRLPSSSQPRPSEVVQADELWQQLLALCPPEHHELLRLRRQGATATEIAAQVGMHAGSVRRVLRDLSIRLACSQTESEVARTRRVPTAGYGTRCVPATLSEADR
jgi:RNA polymerase sigma-70 factor (ECF subfamily)